MSLDAPLTGAHDWTPTLPASTPASLAVETKRDESPAPSPHAPVAAGRAAPLTARERQVLFRIRRLAALNGGRIASAEIGSAGAVEQLRLKGLVRVRLVEVGVCGGRYYDLVPVGVAE